MGIALLIEAILLSRSPTFRWERWIAPVGLCSYSIYLSHLPLLDLWIGAVRKMGYDPRHASVWWISTPLSFIAVLAVCLPLYYLLEEPSAALGSRHWRRYVLAAPTPRSGSPIIPRTSV